MPHVVGALGSKPVASKGLGRGASGGREPKGRRHAVDIDTGEIACGALESLRVFDELEWAPYSGDGDWCPGCAAAVEAMES